MTRLRGIQPHELGEWWPAVEPLIAKGLQYADGQHSLADVKADIEAGRKQLCLCVEPSCAVVTEIIERTDGKRVCNMFLVAGAFPADWRGLEAAYEGWALAKGCTAIEMTTTRAKAWSRRLPDWRPVRVTLRKEL